MRIYWGVGEIHERYGKVIMMARIHGEPHRAFFKDGFISVIPLDELPKEK